jgi:DNA-binding GntR family transcriptional regulator
MISRSKTVTRRTSAPKGRVRAGGPASAANEGPFYLQVAHALKDDIVRGVFPVGSQLPTEGDLSRRFAVSRHTVREALRRLREDGLVSSRQGVGSVVSPPRLADSYVHSINSISDLASFAAMTKFAVDSIKMVLIDSRIAARAGIASEEEWLQVCGYRYAEGAALPLCWTEYYINREFAAVGRLLQRHKGPIFPLIEDMFGQSVTEVQQQVSAVLVSPAMSGGLMVEAGAAALEVRDTYKFGGEKIAQVTISILPSSRYRHSVTLRRVKG